jgi:hypothetical protein
LIGWFASENGLHVKHFDGFYEWEGISGDEYCQHQLLKLQK